MGTFFHPITLIGTAGQRITVDALVDTGATFTTIAAETLRELAVQPRRRVRLPLADGGNRLQELGHVEVQVDGLEGPTYVLFGEPDSPATIGAVALEGFLLGVDPVKQRLVPVEGWWAANA